MPLENSLSVQTIVNFKMESLRSIINSQINRIPPLNPVMLELLNSLHSPNSEVADLKRIIETDANTAANILKIANSPFYGLCGRIKCIQDACVLLGYDQLKNIIYTTALEQSTEKGPHVQWRTMLREHTKFTAIIASYLLENIRFTVVSPSDGYAAGLLHKLGKQIVLAEFPQLFAEYMESEPDSENYAEVFSVVAKQVADRWNLPALLRVSVECENPPKQVPEDFLQATEVVNTAWRLASGLGYPSPGDNRTYSPEVLLKTLDLKADPEELLSQLKMLRATRL